MSVIVETLDGFASAHLENRRSLSVVLPPGYRSAGHHATCKTLYLNDGQDLDALRLVGTLTRLYAQDEIAPLIVVAVPTNADRLQEYGIAHTPDYRHRGSRAGAFTRFILHEVMPAVQAQYRVSTRPEDTAYLGASLGGLSAFDIVWNHPDRFGRAGVFSGSFWWRSRSASVEEMQTSRIAHAMVRSTPMTPERRALKFWFQAGTEDEKDDRDKNGVIDAIQDTTELMDALDWRRAATGMART